MSLSNTATPKYYGQFRAAVERGSIPISQEVELEMNRIDKLIADPTIWYDDEATEKFIRYCENELTLTDGTPLKLLPTFKLWAEQIFGWWYFMKIQVYEPLPDDHPLGSSGGRYVDKIVKYRLTNKQYLIVARGAAKSLYESCLQSYFLNCDPHTTHQITVAPTMAQAEEIIGPIRTSIIKHRGPYFKFLTEGSLQNTTGSRALRQKLVPTKKGVENFLTGSLLEVRPMSIDKLQGLRTKCNTVDEWLSGDLREDVIGAIEQGAMKIHDYLIVAVSSEGTSRNGAGDSIKMELRDILQGDFPAPHVSIWHYKLDSLDEIDKRECWPKAQPNLGMPGMVTWEDYEKEHARMEQVPSARNDIIAKRFGIPMEGHTFFFSYEDTIPHTRHPKQFDGLVAAKGADFSMGDDFCAFTFLFPLSRERWGIRVRSYISELTQKQLSPAMRQKYDEFIAEGTLRVLGGSILDMMEVYEDINEYIEVNGWEVRAFGYDPYNAAEYVNRYVLEHTTFGVEKVRQGKMTETVPLGELEKLFQERLMIFDELLMQFCMSNAMVLEDVNGQRMLYKRHQDEKIDNVSALLNGFVAFKLHKELFE